MRFVVVTLSLLIGCAGWAGEGPAGKLVWSNKEMGFGMVLAVSPDGKELFTAHRYAGINVGDKPAVCRWELATGKLLHKFELHGVGKPVMQDGPGLSYLLEMTATPDGKTLLVSWETGRTRGAYSHHRLQRFDLRTGERRGEPIDDLSSHPEGVRAVRGHCAVSPEGRWFWAHKGGALEQLDVHSCETGKVVLSFKIEKDLQASNVAFTEDGSQAAVFFHHCRGGLPVMRVCSMPGGQTLKEFALPAGKRWTSVHADVGGRMLVEAMEEDDASRKAAGDAAPRPIQAFHRKYYSFDPAAADPGATLKAEPLFQGFHGAALNLPSVCCDAGTRWVATFSEPDRSPQIMLAALKEQGLQWWRSVKVVERSTGKVLAEHQVTPASCFVTRDGRYLVACDPGHETNAGVMVWRLPGR